MRVVGIDPGTGGALALLDAGRFVEAIDMPTVVRSRSKKSTKLMVNGAELARVLRDWQPDAAVVELVNAMPSIGDKRGMGAASAFNFGESAGVVRGVLAALAIETHYVTPQTWKKRSGLAGSDKEASRMKAVTLWPEAPLGRKKDQGRAEALLMARFGVPELSPVQAEADPFRLTA